MWDILIFCSSSWKDLLRIVGLSMDFASFFPPIYQCDQVLHSFTFYHHLTISVPAFKNRFEVLVLKTADSDRDRDRPRSDYCEEPEKQQAKPKLLQAVPKSCGIEGNIKYPGHCPLLLPALPHPTRAYLVRTSSLASSLPRHTSGSLAGTAIR